MRRSTRISSFGLELEDSRPTVGSFSTKFSLPSFVKQVERLTDNQRNGIKRTGFGSLLHIPKMMLSKNLLIELMERWNCEEHAFMLLHGSLKISLMDVALILGLPVVGEPVILKDEEPFSDLEKDYGAVKRKIAISALENRLDAIGEEDGEDFIRTFLLYMFGTLLFPNANGKVDSRYLSFLANLDGIGCFAWGAAVIEEIFMWLDKRKQNNVQSVGGCLIFLQIWSYEHIDIGRPALLDSYMTIPRVRRWGNSRPHQRQWFTERFSELQDSQISWELEPTSSELEIVAFKGLLEEENRSEEVSCSLIVPSSSCSSVADTDSSETESTLETVLETQGSRRQQKLLEKLVASDDEPELQSEAAISPPTSFTPEKACGSLKVGSDQMEALVETSDERQETISSSQSKAYLLTEAFGSSNHESEIGPLTPLSKCQQNLINTATTSNEDDLLKRCKLLEKEITELKGEMEKLRMENMQLRNHFHSTNDLVDRLGRIVTDETEQP